MTRAADAIEGPACSMGRTRGSTTSLREARFVDHHVHGILAGQLSRERLIAGLTETDRPDAAAAAGLDHQLGVAVRRWCAPLLGLPAHVPADEWLRHRSHARQR